MVLFNIRRWSRVRWFFSLLEGGRGNGGSFHCKKVVGGTVVLFNIRWSGVRWFFLIKVGGRGYGGCFYYKVDGGTVVLLT